MVHDTCPNCGYRHKPYLMSTDPEAPGIVGLWKGDGDPFMQRIAKAGTLLLSSLILTGVLDILHVTL